MKFKKIIVPNPNFWENIEFLHPESGKKYHLSALTYEHPRVGSDIVHHNLALRASEAQELHTFQHGQRSVVFQAALPDWPFSGQISHFWNFSALTCLEISHSAYSIKLAFLSV